MKKLAKNAAVIAAVAGAVWALHVLAPLKVAIPVDIGMVFLYAVIMSRPEKVTVSRHLHRTLAQSLLVLLSGGLRAIGGVGFLILAGFLVFTYFGRQAHDVADTAKGKATHAVVEQAKGEAKDSIGGKVGGLFSDLGDDIARAKARHAVRTETPAKAK